MNIVGDVILGYLAIIILLVFVVALCQAAGRDLPELPGVDYADDFARRLSGSSDQEPPSSRGAAVVDDPDITFAAVTPSTRRRTRLAAAHPTSTTPHSGEFPPANRAAASHLYLVP